MDTLVFNCFNSFFNKEGFENLRIHVLFHKRVEKSVEKFEYSLYIAEKMWKTTAVSPKKGGFFMIKGVNRKVIEINHPDSLYFERAVLYLRPDVTEVPMQDARAESEGYVRNAPTGRRRQRLHGIGMFLLGCASAALVWLLMS